MYKFPKRNEERHISQLRRPYVRILQTFWEEVGDDVVQSINSTFDKGELSICQKRGIITLLPKKDKPTDVLNNLRPVTLLNVDYKIATKVIANRFAKVLPDIICPNQTGYVKNRYIGENVRLIADIIDYPKTKEIQGVALFQDFKKAFDSIEWDYLNTERSYKRQGHATLKHFVGFFVQWWKAEITVA